jgi:hypothetical protein
MNIKVKRVYAAHHALALHYSPLISNTSLFQVHSHQCARVQASRLKEESRESTSRNNTADLEVGGATGELRGRGGVGTSAGRHNGAGGRGHDGCRRGASAGGGRGHRDADSGVGSRAGSGVGGRRRNRGVANGADGAVSEVLVSKSREDAYAVTVTVTTEHVSSGAEEKLVEAEATAARAAAMMEKRMLASCWS